MAPENLHFDRKSLRKVTGKSAAWAELALDCVAFANAQGGRLLIGIEDGFDAPPPDQTLPPGLTEAVVKRLRELTVNVGLAASISPAANGAEFITLVVARATVWRPPLTGATRSALATRASGWLVPTGPHVQLALNFVPAASNPRPDLQSSHSALRFVGQFRTSMILVDAYSCVEQRAS